ncbi:hypothetical protein [Acinetobacter calcoaceticus]|uniref:hypothetical protein n=1 Tax=Acinetobacter calcoaceticus TaxID=471 RepID=UPI001E59EFDE|nr:hypothetical protein [Acinetobacter calcoaceticus]UGQ27240.1 hypothetical protein LRO55_05005 [Acinetobacter calcoaceticus]
MTEFFLSTRIPKILGSSESEITAQIESTEQFINKISEIDPIFKTWYINNATSSKPPLDYPFPSENAKNYLFKLRKTNIDSSFLLWNGLQEDKLFASFRFDRLGLILSFSKVLKTEQMIQLFTVLLKYPKYDYVYLNTDFFYDINIFSHRLETTSVCYVPTKIDDNYLPHLYKKVEIDNQYNKGTILVFDENWADETDELKKIVQENSIALIELGAIPEKELPEGFFNE